MDTKEFLLYCMIIVTLGGVVYCTVAATNTRKMAHIDMVDKNASHAITVVDTWLNKGCGK